MIMARHVAMGHRAHLSARNLGLKVDAEGVQDGRDGRRRQRRRRRTQFVGRIDRRRRVLLLDGHSEQIAHRREGTGNWRKRRAEASLGIADIGPPVGGILLLGKWSRESGVTARSDLRSRGGSRCGKGRC